MTIYPLYDRAEMARRRRLVRLRATLKALVDEWGDDEYNPRIYGLQQLHEQVREDVIDGIKERRRA